MSSTARPAGPRNPASERDMAAAAAKNAKHSDKGIAIGKVLPKEFKNPAGGDRGHLCLDLKGRYNPKFTQLMIIAGDATGKYQYFNEGGHPYNVQVGVWVDVPPSVISNIESCVVEETEMDYNEGDPIFTKGVTKVVRTIPRFNFRTMASA